MELIRYWIFLVSSEWSEWSLVITSLESRFSTPQFKKNRKNAARIYHISYIS